MSLFSYGIKWHWHILCIWIGKFYSLHSIMLGFGLIIYSSVSHEYQVSLLLFKNSWPKWDFAYCQTNTYYAYESVNYSLHSIMIGFGLIIVSFVSQWMSGSIAALWKQLTQMWLCLLSIHSIFMILHDYCFLMIHEIGMNYKEKLDHVFVHHVNSLSFHGIFL